jgi:hypothetical protein
MFQVPPAMLNAGLVQLPVCSVWGIRTVAGPTAAGGVVAVELEASPASVEDVELAPALVVAVLSEAPADVGDLAPPDGSVEVEVDPASGGSL